ncbi:MAG: hypothetical protein CVU60_17300 [Deltaproteobacteria bacterium HGW-Deltaproteobacteria-18]|nr:MAG: hypothetical protein CVU60_17300 [Deltaproteobacteria bacterium HGW-Deltaproteobacteria-18]
MIFVLLLLLAPFSAQAASPMDFARGYLLETEADFALQRLELPFEVYNASVRDDLGDLRVFNAEGAEVPMHLRRVAVQAVAAQETPLPLFRISDGPEGALDYDFRMNVRTSDQGAVLETRMTALPAGTHQSLLLDASAITEDIAALRFEAGASSSAFIRVEVQGSDDLYSWRAAGSAVLAFMEHQNGRILQDRVMLHGKRWKYYLLTGQADLSVLARAHARMVGGDADVTRRFLPLHGHLVAEDTYEYALPPALPVDVLDLGDVENAVLGVKVLRPLNEDWRAVAAGALFRLTVDGQLLDGPGLALHGPCERLRIVMQGAPVPLRVGWVPHELVFMPQGPGPFTLAMGKHSAKRAPDMLSAMLGDKKIGTLGLGTAKLAAPVVLGGDDRLLPEPDHAGLVLWAVLGFGVILLGFMAWQLLRTLDQKK